MITDWSCRGWSQCVTLRLTGHTGLAAGLRFSVAGSTGSDAQLLSPARTPVPLPARLGDRQVSGEEKECAAISQRLLHQMKVAVSAAKQDARSVHFRLDRARSRRHTGISPAGVRAGNSRRIRAGLAARKERPMAYVLRDDKARDDHDLPASARPRRRTRHQGRRARTVRFALTDAEYAEVSESVV